MNKQEHGSVVVWVMILLLLSGGACCSPAYGATNDSSSKLAEIVVTATRAEDSSLTIPQSVTTATKEEILERQPAQPVEILRDEPGVWIQKTGAGGGTPVIRGLMGNQVLYLVDGIRINNCTAFAGPSPLFNQVDVGSIDQIEILEGPGSVQYGSDALGGVINIRTKELNLFPDKTTYGGLLQTHYSTADDGVFGHTEAFLAENKYNVFVGGTFVHAGDYRTGSGETLENTSYETRGLTGKFQYRFSTEHILSLGYLETVRTDVERFDQSKRNDSGIPRFFYPEETRRRAYIRDSLDLKTSWISKLESYLYYQQFNGLSDFVSESETRITKNVTDDMQEQYGAGIQAISPLWDSARLIYGIDGRYENENQRITQYTTTKATSTVVQSTPIGKIPDGMYDVLDAFVMANWTPTERARFMGGVRFESTHLKSSPSELDVTEGFTVGDLRLDSRWNSMTYSIGGTYELLDGLILASDVATGFRAPTYSDVLSFGAFTFGVEVPSPNVEPEKITTWEIGPRYESELVSARITYFHSWLRDLITTEPTGAFYDLNGDGIWDAGEDEYTRNNGGRGWIQGVESRAEWRVYNPFTVFGSCTWTDSKNETQNEPLRFTPPLNGIMGVRLQPSTQSWWIEAFARIVGIQDAVAAADKKDPARATDPSRTFPALDNPPLRPDYSIPGYTTYNIRAGMPVRKNSTIFLACENLTDKDYRVAFSRQDAPGVNVTIGAELKF